MAHTRQQWEDRIRARIGEGGVLQHMPDANLETSIERALQQLGMDHPRHVVESFSGDNATYTFTLTSWVDRRSLVLEVEYPAGSRDPDVLAPSSYYVRDGSSDLILRDHTPATGTNNVRVVYTTPVYAFPDDAIAAGADQVPDYLFDAVTALAASFAIHDRAVEFASRRSSTVAGVDRDRDPDGLFRAASNLKKVYDETALDIEPSGADVGSSVPAVIGVTLQDETFPNSLFHRRSQ